MPYKPKGVMDQISHAQAIMRILARERILSSTGSEEDTKLHITDEQPKKEEDKLLKAKEIDW